MDLGRAGGILLHPTSLPSGYGIGDLGQEARVFLDFLKESNCGLWQILPLNPIGYGESPYQSFSAFAGNHLLISLDELQDEGLLSGKQLKNVPSFPEERVDYPVCREYKEKMFRLAFRNFCPEGEKAADYRDFVEKNTFWLPDFALFSALKKYFHNVSWNQWDPEIATRQPEALQKWEKKLQTEMEYQIFLQYEFFRQWGKLKKDAAVKGIRIIGDLPIYVAHDSSDTWVYPQFFELDQLGNPLKVGGVPPDYFSATGQLWGNPIYRWSEMAKDDYFWWRERIKVLLELTDIIRVDHFRGFEAFWEVPGDETTAVHGRWVKGPGKRFFEVILKYLGKLPLIAEDLGLITPPVIELKNKFGFPGMKVLQFIDSEPLERCSHENNCVFYTGTHDNDTLRGWFEKTVLAQLCGCSRSNWNNKECDKICWGFIEIVMQSRAKWAIIPLQDFLFLDSWARMNTPSTVGDNWEWRCRKKDFTPELAQRIKKLLVESGRAQNLSE